MISIRLPEESAFRLDAQAPGGRVVSDFVPSSGEGASVLKAAIGTGGREIRLQTQRAVIEVLKN